MALADITLVLEYIPFLAYTQLIGKPGGWGWAAYLWFHSNFSVVIHNVSVWLTLTVAVWRFIMIKYHTWVPVYCTMERCHLVMLSAYGKWNSFCVKIHLSSVQKWQNWHHACERVPAGRGGVEVQLAAVLGLLAPTQPQPLGGYT